MEGDLQRVFEEAARVAESGEGGALAVVVRVSGSAPQRVGAKLLLRRDGRFVGTVGGGVVEAAILADAVRARDGGGPALCTYRLGADLGMCCGGTMEVYVEPVSGEDADLFREASRLSSIGEAGAFGLVVTSDDGDLPVGAKMLAGRQGTMARDLVQGPLAAPVLRDLEAMLESGEPRVAAYIAPGGREVELYFEPIEATERLVIFGGGHVAQPMAQVGKLLGFRVVVVDERPEWANAERFPDADEIANEPFGDFLFRFEHRPTDYLVIMTRGHEFDQSVLEAVVDKDFQYLGMIGSRAKVKRAMQRLEAAGVVPEFLKRVRAPIGLNLGAKTPQEIAVAIGAELVMVRRGVLHTQVPVPGWWRDVD
jgi:xanthine dehydrogenase accessory factor